jgi:hypothetical protein
MFIYGNFILQHFADTCDPRSARFAHCMDPKNLFTVLKKTKTCVRASARFKNPRPSVPVIAVTVDFPRYMTCRDSIVF